jgi:hypothetical protein
MKMYPDGGNLQRITRHLKFAPPSCFGCAGQRFYEGFIDKLGELKGANPKNAEGRDLLFSPDRSGLITTGNPFLV